MSASPRQLFKDAQDLSVGEAVRRGITTNILAALLGVAAVISASIDVVISGLATLGDNIAAIPAAIASGGAFLIEVGADISAQNLGQLGLLGIIGGVVLALVSIWIFLQFLQEPETGNLFALIPLDIPLIGSEEEEE